MPSTVRPSSLAAYYLEIVELYAECRGNLVRVHEVFVTRHGDSTSYPTLTRYVRSAGIGQKPKLPAGEYHFVPGEEMQHDTSPHAVTLGGKDHVLQCASVVLCHSRMLYMQVFEQFTRLQARIFLTEAFVFFGGAAGRCLGRLRLLSAAMVRGRSVPVCRRRIWGPRRDIGSWQCKEFAQHREVQSLGETARTAEHQRVGVGPQEATDQPGLVDVMEPLAAACMDEIGRSNG